MAPRSTLGLAASLAALSSVNAHMFISSPSPIAGSAPKDPLAGDGSNFPCHGVTLPGAGGQPMAVGSTQLLSFDTGGGLNTAVHGGGSCQLSVTYETDPVKIQQPSSWKVIYSIEEGCPTNSPANLDGSYTGPSGTYSGSHLCNDTTTNGFDCVNQFNFQIPPGMMNGQATLAWTWFNSVGNREMYMNCVAVDITGGNSDDSGMASMPDMFVANLNAAYLGAAATCGTTYNQNVGFPNPGAYHTTRKPFTRNYVASATSQFPIVTPSNCPSNAGSTVSSAAAGSSTLTSSSSSSSSSVASSSSSSIQSSVAQTTQSSTTTKKTTAAAKTSSTKKASTTSAKATVPAKAAGPKSASSSISAATATTKTTAKTTTSSATASSTCAAGSVPCTGLNSLVCVDSTHFGICDYNNCAVSQAVAPGTMCKNNAITWANSKKRDMEKHAKRDAHRQQMV